MYSLERHILCHKMSDYQMESYEKMLAFLKNHPNLNVTQRSKLLDVFWEEYNLSRFAAEIPVSIMFPTMFAFVLMTIFGTIGSSLVIFVVLQKPAMRTRSNMFILNLALSDLTLCVITQPFNLLRIIASHETWVMGPFMCKFTATFQGTNMFVSTISITAIALDRFQVGTRLLEYCKMSLMHRKKTL